MKSNRLNNPNFGLPTSFSRLLRDAFEGLDDLGDLFSKQTAPTTCRQKPRADLFKDDSGYFAVFELPGVTKEELSVELLDGQLEISATVSREPKDGRKNIPIKRQLALPDNVGVDGIKAKLEDGILTVALPKAEAAKPRSIEIE